MSSMDMGIPSRCVLDRGLHIYACFVSQNKSYVVKELSWARSLAVSSADCDQHGSSSWWNSSPNNIHKELSLLYIYIRSAPQQLSFYKREGWNENCYRYHIYI